NRTGARPRQAGSLGENSPISTPIGDNACGPRKRIEHSSARSALVRQTHMTPDDLIALNEEIAGMARAGLPLDRGLAALAKEMGRGRLQQVTAALAQALRAGQTLPQALERQAGRVPPFYAGLVAAGVRTGRICGVLATL